MKYSVNPFNIEKATEKIALFNMKFTQCVFSVLNKNIEKINKWCIFFHRKRELHNWLCNNQDIYLEEEQECN